jgi:hypothetical protein
MKRKFAIPLTALVAMATLTACGDHFRSISDTYSSDPVGDLCEYPDEFFKSTWGVRGVISVEPSKPGDDPMDGAAFCTYTGSGAFGAVLGINTRSGVSATRDAPWHSELIVDGRDKAWVFQRHNHTPQFTANVGTWTGSLVLHVPDYDERRVDEREATDEQVRAAADLLIRILRELKGPDAN